MEKMKAVIVGYASMKSNVMLLKQHVAFQLHFVPSLNKESLAYPQDECLCGMNHIYVRYSFLLELHFNITKQFHLSNLAVQFPPKLLLQTKSVLNKRMKQLELYINYILSLNDNVPLQHFIRNYFLEYINTSTYNDMYLNMFNKQITPSENSNHSDDSDNKVVSLLKELNEFPMNMSEYLSMFEQSVAFLSKDNIYLLFFGSERYKGLVYYIGQYEQNLYGAVSCLMMIAKLIDCEYNVNYDLFRKIFQLGTKSKIELMHLEKIISMNNNDINRACFGLIKCLCEEDEHFNEEFWFMSNTLSCAKYNQWLGSN